MERGIIFSTDAVKAILDGSKSQTRRVIKPQPFLGDKFQNYEPQVGRCPYGQAGSELWVKETFALDPDDQPYYRADQDEDDYFTKYVDSWRPSTNMSRWASRITLENGQRMEVVRAPANTADDYNTRWAWRGPKWNHGSVILPDDLLWHWDWDFVPLGVKGCI